MLYLFYFSASSSLVTGATLKTYSGQQFSNVKVLKVEPDNITIMHKDGGCRLKVEDLPATLQQELGISYNDSAIIYRENATASVQPLKNSPNKKLENANVR
ncbi:MAG: hypothetical protein ACI9FG_000223 [Crocinitomicaceae bacterium]